MTTTGLPNKSRRLRKAPAERPMVPKAEFGSYYGRPILNAPVWEAPDIPGYLFLGGLAGGSSLLAAGADLTGRPVLATVAKTGAAGAGALSMVALVHDLGRPKRFLNMLRVFKVTSPMNVGSWLLSAYVPAAGTAALSALTGRLPRIGAAATVGAAATGPVVAAYTAALISDTAVPAWHDGYPEMPFVFTGSGAMAAGGLGLLGTGLLGAGVLRTSLFRTGLLGAGPLGSRLETGVLRTGLLRVGLLGAASRGPRLRASLSARLRTSLGASPAEAVPARNLALLGAAMETAALERMRHRIGLTAEPYSNGRAGAYIKAGKILAAAGSAGAVLGTTRLLPPKGRRLAAALSGAALLAGSAATRWGIFHAGLASANDPKYTVIPQRQRRA